MDIKFEYPDRLKVFVGTWNMYGRLLDIDLATFLTKKEMLENTSTKRISLDGTATHPYHLLVIGTQECERDISESLFYPSKEIWEHKLSTYLGKHYKMLKTETLAALHVAVFVWLPVAYLIKDIQSESIKTGWANMVGNKGAVAVSVLFGSRSLLFVNCHLRDPSVIDQFDHVFLFGDTNYRVDAERSFVFDALRQGDYNALLEYDQLSLERRRTEGYLRFFQEHPISFPPTYKLDTILHEEPEGQSNSPSTKKKSVRRRVSKKKLGDADEPSSSRVQILNKALCYDSSEKQRVPSWTDRILWCDRAATHHVSPPPFNAAKMKRTLLTFKSKKQHRRDTICYSYDAVLHDSLLGKSDHMPVIGVFGIWFDEWSPSKLYNLKHKKSTLPQQKPTSHRRHWWQHLFR